MVTEGHLYNYLMDNLTHSLVGLTAAKAGLERLSPGATTLCVLAANSPDSDIIVLAFGDRWDFLQHHRGITHAIVGVIWPGHSAAVDLLRCRPALVDASAINQPKTKLKGLMIASFIVSATHPLLDWTNNYGIRFFLPWSQKWSYGDLVYIVDPFLWLVLGGAAFLLTAKTKFSKFIWVALAAVTHVSDSCESAQWQFTESTLDCAFMDSGVGCVDCALL